MSTQHASDAKPHIHLWVTSLEAANMLHCDEADIHEQMDSGDLEIRVTEAGVEEVLICLPSRDPLMPSDTADEDFVIIDEPETGKSTVRVDAEPAEDAELQSGLLPMMQALRWTQEDGVRRARRSAKIGWAVAATLAILTAGSIAAVVLEASLNHRQLETMADEVQSVSDANTRLAGDKAQISHDLQELQQAHAKIQEELAVDREVEDTLAESRGNSQGRHPRRNHGSGRRGICATISAALSAPSEHSARIIRAAMTNYTQSIQSLMNELARLPGIGMRSAERIAFHLLKQKTEEAMKLMPSAIRDVQKTLHPALHDLLQPDRAGPMQHLCEPRPGPVAGLRG